MNEIKRFFKEEDGGPGLEYTLLLLVMVILLTIFWQPIKNAATGIWAVINTSMETANTAGS